MRANFSSVVSAIAASGWGATPALIHGDRTVDYAALNRRAGGLAAFLARAGLPKGGHVGHYLRNRPEYMEAALACGHGGFAHVNVNYRYEDAELAHLFSTLDITAVVYEAEFAQQVTRLRTAVPGVSTFIEVTKGAAPRNDFAVVYDEAAATETAGPVGTPDDLILIATGGTTGMPKGVMWRQGDLMEALRVGKLFALAEIAGEAGPGSVQAHVDNVVRQPFALAYCPFSPLMHGNAFMMALAVLGQGGTVVTVPGTRFDALAALCEAKAKQVPFIGIVGDAFAAPMADALDAHPDEGLLSNVRILSSSGAALSAGVKDRLLAHNPELMIMDHLGSSETAGVASTVTTKAGSGGAFKPVARPVTVLGPDRKPLPAGSDALGVIAVRGPCPVGYYKDPAKTAETFVTVDGAPHVLTGDMGRFAADGAIEFVGRGSHCINTGGEKVFVEEVEAALTALSQVSDAAVFGRPHPRFGQTVTAVVRAGEDTTEAALRQALRGRIADYKIPKRIVLTEAPLRVASGKMDYARAKRLAEDVLGATVAKTA